MMTQVNDRRQHPHDGRATGAVSLVALVAGLLLCATLLRAAAGPPRLPGALPAWADVAAFLLGSEVPVEALGYALTMAAWGLWLWLVVQVLARVAIALAEAVTHGAAWARRLRAASDRFTLPVVRRVVDRALVAGVVVSLAGRAAPAAAAGEAVAISVVTTPSTIAVATGDQLVTLAAPDQPPANGQQASEGHTLHVVAPGENLWKIAEKHYGGDSFQYRRIVAANAGRRMNDGSYFTNEAVIQPGWQLCIPPTGEGVEIAEEGRRSYVVRESDSDGLSGIATRVLGDANRWQELFEANRGVATTPDGRVLTHQDVIWPGLRLGLPLEQSISSAGATVPPAQSGEPDGAHEVSRPMSGNGDPTVSHHQAAALDATVPQPLAEADEPMESLREELEAATGEVHPTLAEAPSAATESGVHARPTAPARGGVLAVAALGAAGAAGVALATRRRIRRSFQEPPVPDPDEPTPVYLVDGFAAAELDRAVALRAHGEAADAVTIVVSHVLRDLRAAGLDSLAVVAVRERRRATDLAIELILRARLPDQPRVRDLAARIGARLGGAGEARATADRDVLLRLSRLSLNHLLLLGQPEPISGGPLPAVDCGLPMPDVGGGGTGTGVSAPLLLPLGVAPDGATVYASAEELGHTLLASPGSDSGATVLAAMVASLAVRSDRDSLRIWTAGDSRGVFGLLQAVAHRPHPGGNAAVAVLRDARAEVERRLRAGSAGSDGAARPRIAVVLGELADVAADDEALDALDTLRAHGTANGVQVFAATSRPEALGEHCTRPFAGRLVFQTPDEEQSVLLLGQPDAADLGGGGNLLAQIDGRSPIQLRGFRVAPEELERIATTIRGEWSGDDRDLGEILSPAPLMVEVPGDPPAAAVTDTCSDASPAAVPAGTASAGGQNLTCLPQPADDQSRGEVPTAIAPDIPATTGPAEARIDDQEAPAAAGYAAGGDTALAGAPAPDLAHPFSADDQSSTAPLVASADELLEVAPGAAPASLGENGSVGNGHLGETSGSAVVSALGKGGERSSDAPAGERGVPPNGAMYAPNADAATPDGDRGSRLEVAVARATAAVRVYCFGDFHVFAGDTEIAAEGDRGAQFVPRQVLAFLAAHPQTGVSKERALALLWPETDEEHGPKRLSVNLSRARRMLARHVPELPTHAIRMDPEGCRLDPEWIWSDVHEFERLIRSASSLPPEEAIHARTAARDLYRADLLTHPYYRWVHERGDEVLTLREQYAEANRKNTMQLAKLYRERRTPALAVPLYKALIKSDPAVEEVVRELYRCYGELGDRKSLILEDRRLRQALRAALGDPNDPNDDPELYAPQDETVAVFQEVLAQLSSRTPAQTGVERAGDALELRVAALRRSDPRTVGA